MSDRGDAEVAERVAHAFRRQGEPDLAEVAAVARRWRRRRQVMLAAPVVLAVAAVAVIVWGLVENPREDVVLDGDRTEEVPVPTGWEDVAVGDALMSVPPAWNVIDARGATGDDEPCPSGPGPTLWVRDWVSLRVSEHCDPEAVGEAMQIAALTSDAHEGLDSPHRFAHAAGQPDRLGEVPAWRATLPRPGDEFAETPGATADRATWLAPAVHLAVVVDDELDADDVLDTVRPHGTADPDGVVLFFDRFFNRDSSPLEYIAITADGRRHVWFTEEVRPGSANVGTSYTLRNWPGLATDRFAIVDVTSASGVRLLAGRPDEGHVVWEQPEVARDLTQGSFPQATWSPDGTALAWYAPRPEPVMGLAQWADVDAIADGQPPVHEQTVAVADGPVQADPPVMRWTADANNDAWTITLRRGQPPPWNPDGDASDPASLRWQLPLAPDDDGTITLADPVTFNRLEAP